MPVDYNEVIRDLEERRGEIEGLLNGIRRMLSAGPNASVPQVSERLTAKSQNSLPKAPTNLTLPIQMNGSSNAFRIEEALNGAPEHQFSIEDAQKATGIELLKNVRSTLARLASEGRIAKVSRGKYQAKIRAGRPSMNPDDFVDDDDLGEIARKG